MKSLETEINQIRDLVEKETGTATGNVNLRGGFLLVLLIAAMVIPADLITGLLNPVLKKIFDLTLPSLSESTQVALIIILILYFVASLHCVYRVESKLKGVGK